MFFRYLNDMNHFLPVAASPARLTAVFALLFIAYQLPEGLGMHILHSKPVLYGLMLAFLPIAWLAGRAIGFRGLDAWFMVRSPRWWPLLLACFGLSVLARVAVFAAGAETGVYQITRTGGEATLMAVAWALFESFIPSAAEDIVTRGFLMRAMPALSRRWVFVPVSAALFVANHIYRLANGPTEWLMLFCFGLAYAAALYYSRSLWAAIGLHWGWNFTGKFTGPYSVDVLAPAVHPLMSAAAHLLMLAMVVAVASRMRKEPPLLSGMAGSSTDSNVA